MCSGPLVGLGVLGVGTLLKGAAAQQRGAAAKAVDYRSADAAERAAGEAVERGKIKDLQVVMRGSKVVADQRVIQSGSGADVNVGAPLATQQATQAVSDVDRATVRRNAVLEAFGLQARAQELRQRGEYAEAEGDAEMVGTFLAGIGGGIAAGGKYVADYQSPTAVDVEKYDTRVES